MPFQFCSRIQQQPWIQLNPFPRSMTAQGIRTWLLDQGSLTKRLKQTGSFSVELVSARYGRPFLSEARTLGISPRQQVYIREVTLSIDGQAMVNARSIIPRSTLAGRERQLLKLNTKPLGEYLFNHAQMKLDPIQIKHGKVNHRSLWGRRRVFRLGKKPVLVSEFFLPAIEKLNLS